MQTDYFRLGFPASATCIEYGPEDTSSRTVSDYDMSYWAGLSRCYQPEDYPLAGALPQSAS